MRFCLGLLLAALSAPTFAQPTPEPRSAVTLDSRAVALAHIVMPAKTFSEVTVRNARANYDVFADASPDFRRMEKDFPGATRYIWKAVEPEWRRLAAGSYPALINDMASTYDDVLDPAEIAAATVFYTTPTGQRGLQTLYGDADFDAAVSAIARAGEVTVEAQAAAYIDSAAKISARATDVDREALSTFQRAVPPEKLRRIFQTLQILVRNRANAPNAARDARLNAISYQASKRWVEQARAKRRPR